MKKVHGLLLSVGIYVVMRPLWGMEATAEKSLRFFPYSRRGSEVQVGQRSCFSYCCLPQQVALRVGEGRGDGAEQLLVERGASKSFVALLREVQLTLAHYEEVVQRHCTFSCSRRTELASSYVLPTVALVDTLVGEALVGLRWSVEEQKQLRGPLLPRVCTLEDGTQEAFFFPSPSPSAQPYCQRIVALWMTAPSEGAFYSAAAAQVRMDYIAPLFQETGRRWRRHVLFAFFLLLSYGDLWVTPKWWHLTAKEEQDSTWPVALLFSFFMTCIWIIPASWLGCNYPTCSDYMPIYALVGTNGGKFLSHLLAVHYGVGFQGCFLPCLNSCCLRSYRTYTRRLAPLRCCLLGGTRCLPSDRIEDALYLKGYLRYKRQQLALLVRSCEEVIAKWEALEGLAHLAPGLPQMILYYSEPAVLFWEERAAEVVLPAVVNYRTAVTSFLEQQQTFTDATRYYERVVSVFAFLLGISYVMASWESFIAFYRFFYP